MKYIVKIDAFLLQRQSDFIQSNSSIYLLNNPCVSLFKRKAASFMGCYSYSAKSMCFFVFFLFFRFFLSCVSELDCTLRVVRTN